MIAKNVSVIKIYNILLVTVPSDPDDETIMDLQDQVLEAMEQHGPKGLILDLSMVETLDSFFARTITETTQMVSVMGGSTVIAGIRPSVAITAVQLGLDMGNIATALNVESALDIIADFGPGGAK